MAPTMRVKHLVVDSSGFIKNAPIFEIGENVYTVKCVVDEIKDKATRQRLQVLPYKLNFREPPTEIIKLISEFAKKSGDYSSLSAVDIQLLALTYMLEKENVGTEHLNTEPKEKKIVASGGVDGLCCPAVGFYDPPDDEEVHIEKADENSDDAPENEGESNEDYDSYESDEDSGWITPSNIEQVKQQMNNLSLDKTEAAVSCLTTDYAMQNVLIQIGLNVMAVDGMLIKRAQTFILHCYACRKTTSIMTKQFCPSCGNKTLKRAAVTTNEDGTQTLHINYKKPINVRGTRYSLPMPKGGKHAINPLLCEDQPCPQNRPSRLATKKTDVFNPDYASWASPFATNDVYSRASLLGIRGTGRGGNSRRNPNAAGHRTGNKKKK